MLLHERVLASVRTHRMIPPGGRVLVALSGGPDSVALALLLRELERPGRFAVAGIAHLNHGLRADASHDEDFCRDFAARLELPFRSARADVRTLAADEKRSLEDAGRRARYLFLDRARAELGADVIATGHTRNDQAETFLLRLIRGAGPVGLAGIYPVSGRVVRPLIDLRREDLLAWLAARTQPFCEDPTNRDLSIPRNRVRHELLPLLERSFSPGIVDVLAREADIARADHAHLQGEAIGFSSLIVLRSSGGTMEPLTPAWLTSFDAGERPEPAGFPLSDVASVELDAHKLAALAPALGSRLARLALEILAPDRFVGSEHVEALLAVASGVRPGVSLPGQEARRRGALVVLERQRARPFENSFEFPLSIPGEVVLAAQGWVVSARPGAHAEQSPGQAVRRGAAADPSLAAEVEGGRLVLPLLVRSRRPGDRLKPAGLGGRHRKLQDVLVDRKVPREHRDTLPIVVDGAGRIVWVVGFPVTEDFRVTEPSSGVILLKARRLGGPG